MFSPSLRKSHGVCLLLGLVLAFFAPFLSAQTTPPEDPIVLDDDSAALMLARQYLEGGPNSRAALTEALGRMGWSIRDSKRALIKAPPSGDTGLALPDYEMEELLASPSAQPSIRLISYAQTLAIPLEGADPEELAQDIVESIRRGAASNNPQQRFWARFIIALGRVSPANYDLAAVAPPNVMQPTESQLKSLSKSARNDPMALMKAMQPKPVWPSNDPVLAPSPLPENSVENGRPGSEERDRLRGEEISAELRKITPELSQADEARQKAATEKMNQLSTEMTEIMYRQSARSIQQTAEMTAKNDRAQNDDEEDDEEEDEDHSRRFTAEWRDQPLSFLQISLLTRVISADLRQIAARHAPKRGQAAARALWVPAYPLAAIGVAQAPAPAPSFGSQFAGAIGDIWATTAGGYTSAVLEHYFPDNKFNKGMAGANAIIAWYKTIMSVLRQKITVQVENVPLIRTKTRSPGQQRIARATVEIDFPKSDMLKAIRAAGNITTLDLQTPDGGPVSGAKVVWRLPEGSHNGRYQNGQGGYDYNPELAIVQFAKDAGFVTSTDDKGKTSITIEGAAQRKDLPANVRPYPRRAAIAVEVTIKVGNMTQDLNDAISLAMGDPVSGSATFLADMVLRTSFFFGMSTPFEVTDWKEPAWQGEFEIIVKGAGSDTEDGEKGGPPTTYTWNLDRYMIGRLHTPEWEEENEAKRNYETGRHQLEIDGASRHFKLKDSSSSKSKKSHNRYQADGPLQIPPPTGSPLASWSRAEPSGSAELVFTGGKTVLKLKPFFGAECLVTRSEQSGGRASNRSGAEYLSLLSGLTPETFAIVDDNDGSAGFVEGSKTFDKTYRGNLPFVPAFDVVVTVKYRLWKSDAPPKNQEW